MKKGISIKNMQFLLTFKGLSNIIFTSYTLSINENMKIFTSVFLDFLRLEVSP